MIATRPDKAFFASLSVKPDVPSGSARRPFQEKFA